MAAVRLDLDEFDVLDLTGLAPVKRARKRARKETPNRRNALRNKAAPLHSAVSSKQKVISLVDDDVEEVKDRKMPALVSLVDEPDVLPQQAADVEVCQVVASPQSQVLGIFPDVDIPFLKSLFDQGNSIQAIMSRLTEEQYPRNPHYEKPKSTAPSFDLLADHRRKWSVDFTSPSSFTPTKEYKASAIWLLQDWFPGIRKSNLRSLFKQSQYHFAICVERIYDQLKTAAPQHVYTVMACARGVRFDPTLASQIVLLKARKNKDTTPLYSLEKLLAEENDYCRQKYDPWWQRLQHQAQVEARGAQAVQQGVSVPCACCYDDMNRCDVVQCRNPDAEHLFCSDCLENYVKNLVFAGNLGPKQALDLQCFHGDGCTAGFRRHDLETCLTADTLRQYDKIQYQKSIDAAGVPMASCPKCNFQAQMVEGQRVLECLMPECRFSSCIECGEESHVPYRCDEVEKKKETDSRLTVEEAISAAKIRNCPKCRKAFVKESGCNKITCASCGTKSCYICKEPIAGYEHFCKKPHCQGKKCGKCHLHTNAEEDDARIMREIGTKVAREEKEASGVDVNVAALL